MVSHIYSKLTHLAPTIGMLAMLATVDTYMEGLPKIRRALVAAALLIASGFGGGVTVTIFGIRGNLETIQAQHVAIGRYVARDSAEMKRMQTAHVSAIGEVKDAVNDLICEMNDIQHSRCNWWIANGRPN